MWRGDRPPAGRRAAAAPPTGEVAGERAPVQRAQRRDTAQRLPRLDGRVEIDARNHVHEPGSLAVDRLVERQCPPLASRQHPRLADRHNTQPRERRLAPRLAAQQLHPRERAGVLDQRVGSADRVADAAHQVLVVLAEELGLVTQELG